MPFLLFVDQNSERGSILDGQELFTEVVIVYMGIYIVYMGIYIVYMGIYTVLVVGSDN